MTILRKKFSPPGRPTVSAFALALEVRPVIAVNAQLRADEQRLRTKQTGDVFARLLKIIQEEKKIIEEEKKQPPKAY